MLIVYKIQALIGLSGNLEFQDAPGAAQLV